MAEHLIKRTYDPHTRITEEFWYEEIPGAVKNKIHIRRFQDVEGTLDLNKAQRNMDQHAGRKFANTDGLFHAGRIPFAVIEKWMREDGFNWFTATTEEKRKKLNENPYLKTIEARL